MTETASIDLTPFLGDGTIYRFAKPFIRSGWKYATDGRICVRVPTTEPDTENGINGATTIFPAVLDGWTKYPEPPDYVIGQNADCPKCNAKGVTGGSKCEACDGSSECQCMCGDEHECNHCNGTGIVNGNWCRHCNGLRRGAFPAYTVLAGRAVSFKYSEKIRVLPAVEYADVNDATGKLPLAFRFTGGDGVVMPLSPDSLRSV